MGRTDRREGRWDELEKESWGGEVRKEGLYDTSGTQGREGKVGKEEEKFEVVLEGSIEEYREGKWCWRE